MNVSDKFKHWYTFLALGISTFSGYSVVSLLILFAIALWSIAILRKELEQEEVNQTHFISDFRSMLKLMALIGLMTLTSVILIYWFLGTDILELFKVMVLGLLNINIYEIGYSLTEMVLLSFPVYNSYRAYKRSKQLVTE